MAIIDTRIVNTMITHLVNKDKITNIHCGGTHACSRQNPQDNIEFIKITKVNTYLHTLTHIATTMPQQYKDRIFNTFRLTISYQIRRSEILLKTVVLS